MKSPRVTGKSPSVALNGSTPSASSRRATMMARHSESRPESTSTRSSDSGARLLRCSLATCSKCERTVALTDMTSTFIETLRPLDRKSTRLNSSHTVISYAVFCLKKKKKQQEKNNRNYAKYKKQRQKKPQQQYTDSHIINKTPNTTHKNLTPTKT